MGKETAKTFVERMFEDEEFLKEVCRHGGFKQNVSDEEKTRLILKASGEMGYEFSGDDYSTAMQEYFEGKGALAAIKAFRKLNKAAKAAEKGKL